MVNHKINIVRHTYIHDTALMSIAHPSDEKCSVPASSFNGLHGSHSIVRDFPNYYGNRSKVHFVINMLFVLQAGKSTIAQFTAIFT